ncbi:MAG: endo-1,4-beta-xylanase [Defluviitaleaceae bacterium]|nr:endo-1,4-beta-xylanase [Defluviitaleaceae bacterium]
MKEMNAMNALNALKEMKALNALKALKLIFLAITLSLLFTSCGKPSDTTPKGTTPDTTHETTTDPTDPTNATTNEATTDPTNTADPTNTTNTTDPTNTNTSETTTDPTTNPTTPHPTEPTPALASTSLKIETMGNVQWDGVQIATAELGLESENVYEISLEIFTAMAGSLDVGILMQTNGPLWRHIIATEFFEPDSALEWHSYTGELDLRGVDVPDSIQIVKNTSGPNPSANTTFYIDNFTVRLDGEIVALFSFEDGETEPFSTAGTAVLTTAVADPAAERDPTPYWDLTLPSLAERWAEHFIVGNAIDPRIITNNQHGVVDMYLHQYGAVTAENSMKVDAVSGGANQRNRPANLNLSGARAMVEFAEQNNLYMVGHALVWHSQSSQWLYRDGNNYLTRAEAMENMRWFIENYAGHFEGRIHAWDVVNEAFTDGGSANVASASPDGSPVYPVGTWQRALRNTSPWYIAFANGADFEAGERAYDYIYYAYVFTRRYAPSAVLIYNDFNEESPHKRNAMASMTEELNERWRNDSENNPAYGNPSHPEYDRLLIEAIGMQSHYNNSTNMDNVRAALERFAQTGARIHVSELDIHFGGMVPAPFTMTDLQAERQADMFAQLFTWYEEFSDYIDRVTLWGREDYTSWRGSDAATHFDRFYRPKPAFWAMHDPEGWRERVT